MSCLFKATLQEPIVCQAEAGDRDWMAGHLVQIEKSVYIQEAITGERDTPTPAQIKKLAMSDKVR